MKRILNNTPLLSLAILFPVVGSAQAPVQTDEFFEKTIRPIFVERCHGCHNPKLKTAGLDLTSAAAFRKGADTGPIVAAGEPKRSRILEVLSYRERVKMPPSGRLEERQLAAIREWVKLGAPWPGPIVGAEGASTGQTKKQFTRAQREFWSLRPFERPSLPDVKHASLVRSPVDRFLLARLEQVGLEPAPPADRRTLIRRATFDLTGLPPSEQEIREFLADGNPGAFERVIDRLLGSPRYGEKWGRFWLDVARYADSTGADEDHRYPHAWRYRDYVIDAFNRDLPYDQFIREQIAGDTLPSDRPGEPNVRGIVATGFLALGPKLIAEQDKTKMLYDLIDEQIDVTGKAILGLTLACARCHDHKFDPISTRDYYSLAAIFASSKQLEKLEGTVSKLYFAPLVPGDVAARFDDHQKKIEAKQKEIADLVAAEAKQYREKLAPAAAAYMLAAHQVYSEGRPASAVASEAGLDLTVLERWSEYLKPSQERRAHLEPWYKTPAASLKESAAKYQEDLVGVMQHREQASKEWKVKADAARARGEEPPPAPRFLAGDNRFYTEVVAGKGPLALQEKDHDRVLSADSRSRIAALKQELEALKKSGPPEPPMACAVGEGKPVEQRVFLRGNPEARGELVSRQFPVILAGENQPPITDGSGRRQLAGWLSDPKNPLPARVMVNRIWQGHFGEGLVRTPSNFGITGERPTHPELLDWLASEFVTQGWSVKKMHRLIMLSNAYQMSSETTPEKREKDADGRVLSHFRMRRLTIEELRDSLLNLDGSLDLTVGGTLQSGTGTDKEFSDDRKSLHPDASKRRTVYLPLRRSNLPTMFTLFDFGDATNSNEMRSQTNVAPQALFAMNSSFVAERSRSLAQKLLATETADANRVERAWFLALGRAPDPHETDAALSYIKGFPGRPTDDNGRLLAWSSLCRTLIASNDFLYVH